MWLIGIGGGHDVGEYHGSATERSDFFFLEIAAGGDAASHSGWAPEPQLAGFLSQFHRAAALHAGGDEGARLNIYIHF